MIALEFEQFKAVYGSVAGNNLNVVSNQIDAAVPLGRQTTEVELCVIGDKYH